MRISRVLAGLFFFAATGFALKVRVGHIGAFGAMKNGDKILEISRKELWKEGYLGDDFDVELINQMGCGDSFEGVAVGADMYHVQKVRAFIGPYCNAELDAVAKMATFWNVPVVGYIASSNQFADKAIYKIGIATNTGALAFERVSSFEEVFHARGVSVNKKIMFDEGADAQAMINSGLLSELRNNARVILCIFSATRDASKEFMKAVYMTEMNTHDFVFILPWLQTEAKDTSPWIGPDGQLLQNTKDHYANAIIIDDVNGFDNALVNPFRERVEANGLSIAELDLTNIYGYIHLYDALRLYVIAVRKGMNESGNPNFAMDGRAVWNKMRRLVSIEGISSGTVRMDDLGERAPIYAAFFIHPNRDAVMKMTEMEPLMRGSECDGLKTKSGCYDLKITDLISGFWPSADGSMPPDEPACGFRNERCDYTLFILVGAILLFLLIGFIVVFLLFRICQDRALAKTPWRIDGSDFRVINEDEMKSILSIGSTRTRLSNMSAFVKHHAVVGTNTHASFHVYPQRRPITFIRTDMQLLTNMKQAVHDNLNPFLGICFNEKEDLYVLWKFCSRGTLQDIIYNKEMALDSKFHGAFIRDITLGLEYLHSSVIGYHGSLSPWSCLIDRNWMIKLSDYGIANALERWEKGMSISVETLKEGEDKSAATQKTSILYNAPELLKNRESNRLRTSDQSWMKQTQAKRQAGDIYSFGMVMYEILFRALPFPSHTDVSELVEYLRDGSKIVRPTIQDRSDLHPDLIALLQDCWSENPEVRPTIRRVRLNTESYLKVRGSLVDQMMRMMEQYANNLEKLVKERTGMLEEANIRADRLLSQLLPRQAYSNILNPYVANELKMGRTVPPKTFTCATIMFSDIVGFTTLCSTCTPLEVVNMLNCIYSGFDDVINRYEAYKVETIGDAYMVVSGIPEENGNKHIASIGRTAVGIMEFLKTMEIPHKRRERIRIRLGIHSGSVAAGVVGLIAPRYCLFGDTVNVASRMESSSQPEMIQMSEPAYDLMRLHYPEFQTTLRGTVEVKGLGKMTTYWLEGIRSDQQQQQQQQPSYGDFSGTYNHDAA